MSTTPFTFETDADGFATLTWAMPGRPMNVIDETMVNELEALVAKVAADPAIKGVVVASGKDTFSGGADLTMLETMGARLATVAKEKGEQAAKAEFFEASRKLSLVYRQLEKSGKPWVAAINGMCLGGGFEFTLACHYRICGDDPKLRVGLPEVKIGLFPGAGGTQRVTRMMASTQDALQMLLKGDQLKADKALKFGLINEIVPQGELINRAKAKLKEGVDPVKPWDKDGFKLPGGTIYSKGGMMFWPAVSAFYVKETHDNYPGARAIIKAVYEGLQVPMDTALRIESRYFMNVLMSPEAKAMIRSLFVSLGELNKGARRPAGVAPTTLKTVGVVGAGFMGAGIAYVSAQAGLKVILIDRDQEAADKGKAHSDKLLSDAIKKGRTTPEKKEAVLAQITASSDYSLLKEADLVIEAVFEDRKIKETVIKQIEANIRPDTVLASNTSTLPITSLAEYFADQPRFIGIHFFSPVDKMMLVELIMGAKTGDKALAAAIDFVRVIKKTPIVVNDCRGFFANRCVGNYVREGHLMFAEGVPAAMIENVAKQAGMPVGPLSLNDEVAIDLSWRIIQATKADLGANAIDPAQESLIDTLVNKQGRLGRKNGKGFYDYPEKGQKSLWPGLADLQATKLDPDTLDVTELKQRFLVTQALEAARTVEEGVVTDPREADIGSILGFGFAPYTGGALSYIDMMGTKAFVALAQKLTSKYGSRFEPCALLVDMAKTDDRFYRRFAPKKAA